MKKIINILAICVALSSYNSAFAHNGYRYHHNAFGREIMYKKGLAFRPCHQNRNLKMAVLPKNMRRCKHLGKCYSNGKIACSRMSFSPNHMHRGKHLGKRPHHWRKPHFRMGSSSLHHRFLGW